MYGIIFIMVWIIITIIYLRSFKSFLQLYYLGKKTIIFVRLLSVSIMLHATDSKRAPQIDKKAIFAALDFASKALRADVVYPMHEAVK